MASVAYREVSKIYPDGTRAVRDLDLEIADGEFMVLVGPSGCGKTTALRMAGGLEDISEGQLLIGGRPVNDLGPRERDVAMVFQNYALYPHMSVFENIAFPLRAQGTPRSEIRERVERTARLLGLEDELRRRPRNLSGGQRQRVAMGRALVRQPQVFLMDEPLSNLDAKLRVEMRAEIAAMQQRLGVTTLYVTHDQVEAMTMGQRIAVIRKGVLQQAGPPFELYDRPANLFVAGFIGSPPMNLFRAKIDVLNGRAVLILSDQHLALPDGYLDRRPELAARRGREVAVGSRPEHMLDGRTTDPVHPRIHAEVALVEVLGPERHVHLTLGASPVSTPEVLEVVRDVDESFAGALARHQDDRTARAIARFEADAEIAPHDTAEIAVVADRLRFFDLDTGVAIDHVQTGADRPRPAPDVAATIAKGVRP